MIATTDQTPDTLTNEVGDGRIRNSRVNSDCLSEKSECRRREGIRKQRYLSQPKPTLSSEGKS